MKDTSIAYLLTNKILLEDIFFNWIKFHEILEKGPNAVTKKLFDLWNVSKDKLINIEDLNIIDLDKNPTIDNFDVTSNVTKNNIRIFYFIFPDADIALAQCKCTALVLTPNNPRYFTMEYFSKTPSEESFFFGEWTINDMKNGFTHKNYGKLNNPTIDNFAKQIHNMLVD